LVGDGGRDGGGGLYLLGFEFITHPFHSLTP